MKDPLFIENTATYTPDGRFIKTTTDSLFNTTNYVMNENKGLVNSITDANGNTVNYTYNSNDQITKIAKGNMYVNYEYNSYNLLSKIIQDNKQYQFVYDDFLNSKEIYINDNKLITNNYEENNGNLLSSIYGNNDVISYEYDSFNRINKLIKMDNTYQNYYDNFGNLRIIISNDNQYYYDYDFAKRLINYKENLLEIHYKYNSLNNLVDKKISFNNQNYVSTYEYDEEDNIIKFTNDIVINNTFDKLGRLNKKQCDNYIINYNYRTNGNRTSTLIDKVNDNFNSFEYKYNKLGNIIKINQNDTIINYFYDEYNQLIKEVKNDIKILYTYDNFGNILNKKTYQNDILIDNNIYTYNTNWLDQLHSYNDILITYDNIGNPITIGNNTLSWINGRQLKEYNNNDLTVSYKYNKDGIRTSKTVNGVKYNYYLEGNKILFRQNSGNVLYFIRDENENLIGFKYNNVLYYYIKNIQEDILGIQNSNFEQIVTYEYDSYGKITSIKDNNHNEITDSDHIGLINPFRYRSYYYDNETELYYLNSRYYNPTWGRFINADNYLNTDSGFLGYNMYVYADNNPINYVDPTGHFITLAMLGLIVGIGSLFIGNTIYQNNKAKKEIKAVQTKTNVPDKTSELDSKMKQSATNLKKSTTKQNPIQKLNTFTNAVKTGSDYDLKNKSEWQQTISYNGTVMEPQDIGNFHFGYIGRAMGYDITFLTVGAGAYQMIGNTRNLSWCLTTSLCDDPRDAYYIKMGAIKYDSEN